MYRYQTHGTCSREICFEVDTQGKLRNVSFIGGCRGNLQGVGRLVEGRTAEEVENLLSGVICRGGTSCPDQLSKAMKAYREGKLQEE